MPALCTKGIVTALKLSEHIGRGLVKVGLIRPVIVESVCVLEPIADTRLGLIDADDELNPYSVVFNVHKFPHAEAIGVMFIRGIGRACFATVTTLQVLSLAHVVFGWIIILEQLLVAPGISYHFPRDVSKADQSANDSITQSLLYVISSVGSGTQPL